MERTARFLIVGLMAISLVMVSAPASSQPIISEIIMSATHIVNLEANPKWFKPDQPIDFIVTIRNDGLPLDGFDVGVFHEGRLVGWETNKRLKNGINTFKLRDRRFTGDRGDYIVKVRFKGSIFKEKRFATRPFRMFTIDPAAGPPKW
jgi:hypothetical protein